MLAGQFCLHLRLLGHISTNSMANLNECTQLKKGLESRFGKTDRRISLYLPMIGRQRLDFLAPRWFASPSSTELTRLFLMADMETA
jgi:hypothetical protein